MCRLAFGFSGPPRFITYTQTDRHTDIQTYRRTGVQTYRRTDVQTYRRTDVQTYRRTDVQTYRRTYTHTHIHTYTHTYTDAHTHIYIYISHVSPISIIYIYIYIYFPCFSHKHGNFAPLDTPNVWGGAFNLGVVGAITWACIKGFSPWWKRRRPVGSTSSFC